MNVICLVSSKKIIDSTIGDDKVLDCPINQTKSSHPSIFQWRRSINNYSIPIVSQFDDYPVHIDDLYRNKYSLGLNGSLKIENIQLDDNDTFECRLILIDRGLLDIKEQYFTTLRVNGILFKNIVLFILKVNLFFLFQSLRVLSIILIPFKLLYIIQQSIFFVKSMVFQIPQ